MLHLWEHITLFHDCTVPRCDTSKPWTSHPPANQSTTKKVDDAKGSGEGQDNYGISKTPSNTK
eukprot:12885216-Prorocentrum_lima.AAC.1